MLSMVSPFFTTCVDSPVPEPEEPELEGEVEFGVEFGVEVVDEADLVEFAPLVPLWESVLAPVDPLRKPLLKPLLKLRLATPFAGAPEGTVLPVVPPVEPLVESPPLFTAVVLPVGDPVVDPVVADPPAPVNCRWRAASASRPSVVGVPVELVLEPAVEPTPAGGSVDGAPVLPPSAPPPRVPVEFGTDPSVPPGTAVDEGMLVDGRRESDFGAGAGGTKA